MRLSDINHDHKWTLLFRRITLIPFVLGRMPRKPPDNDPKNTTWHKSM